MAPYRQRDSVAPRGPCPRAAEWGARTGDAGFGSSGALFRRIGIEPVHCASSLGDRSPRAAGGVFVARCEAGWGGERWRGPTGKPAQQQGHCGAKNRSLRSRLETRRCEEPLPLVTARNTAPFGHGS